MAIRNVRLDSKVHDRQVLDRVLVWIQTADNAKALAVMDISANFVQSWAEGGKGKVVSRDKISIQAQRCFWVSMLALRLTEQLA